AAAKRAAIYRFTWEKGRQAKVLVNLPYGNGQEVGNQFAGSYDGKVTKLGDCRIEGEHFRTGCIMRRRIAFALEFSRPWTACEELPKGKPDELPRHVLSFDLKDGEALLLKSAFSMNSPEAARRNLLTSIPKWDFDGVKSATRAAWNDLLSRSVCEGTDEQKKNWYTALYHLYFQPNDYSDADEKPYYTTLSLWDTFRACHPWYSIVTPEVNVGAVDSFMRHYRTFGRLPVMSYGGMNFDCMIGNHSVPVIVDAFLKEQVKVEGEGEQRKNNSTVGLRASTSTNTWDSVYAAIKNTLTKAHPGKPKENWDIYDQYGYFPHDRIDGEGVSRTFECAYDDWCAAQMAKGLGKADDSAFFMKRAGYWKNVFDSSIGFARGKSSDGKWREPFDPFAFGHGAGRDNDFTEGNAFQYTWHVMHDVDGLVVAMGGREAALKKLEALFTADAIAAGAPPDVTGLIGQYVHGNEPSHHVIYLFSLLGRPDLAARYVREVFDKFYLPKPDGLCGNDDCGQMSAWYLFSAMGFYPLNPCGGEYVIGAPQVPRAEIEVEKRGGGGQRNKFTVIARGLSKENKYVKSVMLNGEPVADWKIRHADIVKGGELVFEMGKN
ncbi:MAG: GH92 family glycosyl hydrolase, partial [bacterium]|nr:GH92 family glycosyl hydrolase [Candidatus Colisoma equi]